ncbi:unnamed protein product [Bemisia tabaci]|uniref:Ribosomal RNA methyltransferase FtsJ domain-containing protein n=1 Tax=Bemisia tabaci TaxID=7038 RepID=A0A9P0A5N5_BEMTA|nr:unnamed protein product [Bemisia tabaci]
MMDDVDDYRMIEIKRSYLCWRAPCIRCRLNETTHQPKVKIVSVDVQEMAPHPFLEIVQGDITKINTVKQILEKFNGNRVDCVVCDGAPDVTGNNDMDLCLQEHLLSAAYAITCCILKAGGSFVAKIFRGKNNAVTLNLLRTHFSKVLVAKPRCSRNSSIGNEVMILSGTKWHKNAFFLCKRPSRIFYQRGMLCRKGTYSKYKFYKI